MYYFANGWVRVSPFEDELDERHWLDLLVGESYKGSFLSDACIGTLLVLGRNSRDLNVFHIDLGGFIGVSSRGGWSPRVMGEMTLREGT